MCLLGTHVAPAYSGATLLLSQALIGSRGGIRNHDENKTKVDGGGDVSRNDWRHVAWRFRPEERTGKTPGKTKGYKSRR